MQTDIHKKQNGNKCQMCDVSSKCYDRSEEGGKPKGILRGVWNQCKEGYERIFKIWGFFPEDSSTIQAIIDDMWP